MNIGKELRHGDEMVDIVIIKQEGNLDVRHIINDPMQLKIERCVNQNYRYSNNFDYFDNNFQFYIHLNTFVYYSIIF